MRDAAVDNFLAALKFVHDWFATSKIMKKFYTALYTDDGLLFSDEDSDNLTFCSNKMGILSVKQNHIVLDNDFDKTDPATIILPRLFAWH